MPLTHPLGVAPSILPITLPAVLVMTLSSKLPVILTVHLTVVPREGTNSSWVSSGNSALVVQSMAKLLSLTLSLTADADPAAMVSAVAAMSTATMSLRLVNTDCPFVDGES